MANPKKVEQKEHQERKNRYMAHFKNAAEVLDEFVAQSYLKTFPKDPRSMELLEQFFMAHALPKHSRPIDRIFSKIQDHFGENREQRNRFTLAYMRSDYVLGNHIRKLQTPTAEA